ncbi:MAG: amino acid deaminase [Aeromicrobium sp.]|nr:amino acid deaminase [Aeromicrobium sp.]
MTQVSDAMFQLRSEEVPATAKGWGAVVARRAVSAESLRRDPLPLFSAGFTFPLATLDAAALGDNVRTMADYCRAQGVELAPHGKTTMSPEIAWRQLAAGAWGITVATVSQLQAYRTFGIRRLLMANQLADVGGIQWLVDELAADPDFEAIVCVDSADGVSFVADVAAMHGIVRPLPVLVELGHSGGRTGSRSLDSATEVAVAVSLRPELALAGVTGYEGTLGHHGTGAEVAVVRDFCRDLRELGHRLSDLELLSPEHIVSAGGSLFFDVVCDELTRTIDGRQRPTVVLRSGAYVSHDDGYYAGVTPSAREAGSGPILRPAIRVWAPVLSRPEPGLALLLTGRRDVGWDEGLPVVLGVRRRDGEHQLSSDLQITALNDQHAFLELHPSVELAPGDLVCLGISHPCTTFDKWRVIPILDEHHRVVDLAHTYF